MKFVDEVVIRVRGGEGGSGCSSFRRTRHNPRGGPDGGNGGRGGDVVLRSDPQRTTLLELRFPKALYQAAKGTHGSGNDKHGRGGEDLVLGVPVGTLCFDTGADELLGELAGPGETLVVARGGKGGRGNATFKSARRRSPTRSDPGGTPEEREIRLELKLLADAGLIGFPNAGKSTLLSRVSAARPRVADHPFTTKEPVLGVVDTGDFDSFVLADLPGLIEGASRGAGLGHRFLRHVERARVLVHLVALGPLETEPPVERYHRIRAELSAYDPAIGEKPEIIVPSKMDLPDAREVLERCREELEELGRPVVPISAATGEGLPELVAAIREVLARLDGEDEVGEPGFEERVT